MTSEKNLRQLTRDFGTVKSALGEILDDLDDEKGKTDVNHPLVKAHDKLDLVYLYFKALHARCEKYILNHDNEQEGEGSDEDGGEDDGDEGLWGGE